MGYSWPRPVDHVVADPGAAVAVDLPWKDSDHRRPRSRCGSAHPAAVAQVEHRLLHRGHLGHVPPGLDSPPSTGITGSLGAGHLQEVDGSRRLAVREVGPGHRGRPARPAPGAAGVEVTSSSPRWSSRSRRPARGRRPLLGTSWVDQGVEMATSLIPHSIARATAPAGVPGLARPPRGTPPRSRWSRAACRPLGHASPSPRRPPETVQDDHDGQAHAGRWRIDEVTLGGHHEGVAAVLAVHVDPLDVDALDPEVRAEQAAAEHHHRHRHDPRREHHPGRPVRGSRGGAPPRRGVGGGGATASPEVTERRHRTPCGPQWLRHQLEPDAPGRGHRRHVAPVRARQPDAASDAGHGHGSATRSAAPTGRRPATAVTRSGRRPRGTRAARGEGLDRGLTGEHGHADGVPASGAGRGRWTPPAR